MVRSLRTLILVALVWSVAGAPAYCQTVVLNEVMASNGATIPDEDGEFMDWIELYNPGSAPVSLKDFGLSDNYDAPFKWTFPDVVIGPKEFLLVWASGKDRQVPDAPLHTNFRVSREGEEVLLTSPQGVRIDELAPREIDRDVSVGRRPDGTGAWFYFRQPTPGRSNIGETLLHYWNFNDTNLLLQPTYTRGGAALAIQPGPNSQVTHATGQRFSAENARLRDAAEAHLRLNDPLGATLTLSIPTVGHKAIVLQYESRRSGQGAGRQQVSYSLNGTAFTPFDTVEVHDDDPLLYTLDFSEIEGAGDNPNFAVRIAFEQGDGGAAGNNRFDNLTVEGVPLPGTNVPPQLAKLLGSIELAKDAPAEIDLAPVFTDLENDPLTFSVWSTEAENPGVVHAAIVDARLILTPLQPGEVVITVEARDGINAAVQELLWVTVPGDEETASD
jgi:hypothetical protein